MYLRLLATNATVLLKILMLSVSIFTDARSRFLFNYVSMVMVALSSCSPKDNTLPHRDIVVLFIVLNLHNCIRWTGYWNELSNCQLENTLSIKSDTWQQEINCSCCFLWSWQTKFKTHLWPNSTCFLWKMSLHAVKVNIEFSWNCIPELNLIVKNVQSMKEECLIEALYSNSYSLYYRILLFLKLSV